MNVQSADNLTYGACLAGSLVAAGILNLDSSDNAGLVDFGEGVLVSALANFSGRMIRTLGKHYFPKLEKCAVESSTYPGSEQSTIRPLPIFAVIGDNFLGFAPACLISKLFKGRLRPLSFGEAFTLCPAGTLMSVVTVAAFIGMEILRREYKRVRNESYGEGDNDQTVRVHVRSSAPQELTEEPVR